MLSQCLTMDLVTSKEASQSSFHWIQGWPDDLKGLITTAPWKKKLDHTLARKNDRPTWCGVIVVVWWCFCGVVFVVVFLWWFCGGVFVVVFLWWCFWGGVLWWCFCGGVLVVVLVWWCFCGGVFVVVFLCWCFCAGVGVVVFLWWCFCGCGGVFVVVFLWWFCGGVFVVVFLWWCFWGGVLWWCSCCCVGVVVFLWGCFCGGVFVVVFLWWCFWGGVLWWCSCCCVGVFVVVFLCWCFCAGVFVVVFLWWCFCGGVFVVWLRWCSCGGVLVVVYKVLLQYYKVLQSTTPYYKVLLQYYKVLLQYYSVLQSTTPVLLRTTKYYSVLQSTTLYYTVLLQYYKVLLRTRKDYSSIQSTTATSETTSERRPSSTTSYYASTTKASKTSISCEASATFQGTSFQNEHFVRGFLQISQNELPKRAFRTMLPTIFTEKASKRIVSCEASSKFHRRSFQNDRFVRGFLQISQNHASKRAFCAMLPTIFTEKASKMIVSCEASSKFHRISFQNERFARCFRQFSRKISVSLQFRAMDTPLPARRLIRQKQNVPRTTTPCIPKCDNARFASAPCTKMYESIHREPTRFAHTKM